MPILTDDMKRVVREQTLGFVATVCPDGTPNLSPKGTTTVWDDDHLVYADLASPGTTVNLRKNPAVEVNVVDVVTRTGYRFKGRGAVHVDGPLFDEVVAFYQRDRQMAPTRVRGIVMIGVESAAPLESPAYALGLSRAEVVDRSLRRLERVYGVRIVGTGDARME
jgi:predicted pyridoxine 5'-phosphate oxidase superfamily flavin-nucleotide-binding protein